MGKVTRWLRSLLGRNNISSPATAATREEKKKPKRKWGLAKSADISDENGVKGAQFKNVDHVDPSAVDAGKHAIAVAAATAAVAEAALAAAHAAAEVVRLTSGGRSTVDRRGTFAAVKIQSAFRAYLARRALRALKGLVKLQSLVRGRIVRKRCIIMLRRMQTMARIQARASASRSYMSESSSPNKKFSRKCHPLQDMGILSFTRKESPSSDAKQSPSHLKQCSSRSSVDSKFNKGRPDLASIWLDRWMEQSTSNNHNDRSLDDNASGDKILEIDTWKPRENERPINRMSPVSEYFSAWNDNKLSTKLQNPNPSISSEDVSYLPSPMFVPKKNRAASCTGESSPVVHCALSRHSSHRRLSFTPTRSECSRSLVGDFFGHPNYMVNTESSLAKVRSHSAPKQRMQPEEAGLASKLALVRVENDVDS